MVPGGSPAKTTLKKEISPALKPSKMPAEDDDFLDSIDISHLEEDLKT